MTTHKAVATLGAGEPLALIDTPSVKPGLGEIRARVLWAVSAPLDLYMSDAGFLANYPQILGAGVAAEVVEIGPGVNRLSVGNKVFGSAWSAPHEKAHQEYIVAPEYLFGKIPHNVPPEGAVTLTGNFVTAWHILTSDLEIKLPFPKPDDYTPPDADKPFFIWGAATSVGQYIVQLLKYYGFKHVVVTASRRHHEFLKNIGATSTFDYHDKTVVEDLRGALGAKPIYAIDCAGSAKGSIEPFAKVVPNGSTVDVMLPIVLEEPGEGRVPKLSMGGPDFVSWAKDVTVRTIVVGRYIENEYNKQHAQPDIMPTLLEIGAIKPNRHRTIEGDTLLERAQNALDAQRRKETQNGERLVWRVTE